MTAPSFLIGLKPTGKQNFTNTDYAFKLYNQAHLDRQITPPKEPRFSDFYQPSKQQKQGELLIVRGSALALGYVAFRFLLTFTGAKIQMLLLEATSSPNATTALRAAGKVSKN